MITYEIKYKCDIPECKSVVFSDKVYWYMNTPAMYPHIPMGWMAYTIGGSSPNKLLCETHTEKFRIIE